MADIRPFRGTAYDPGKVDLDRVLCAPYDVISAHQQEGYYARDEHNAVRIILNRAAGQERYSEATRLLAEWLEDGVLRRDRDAALYIHRHSFATRDGLRLDRVGILAAVRLEPWSTGAIRPHEHTMPGPKQDRLELMRATHTDTEPIWVFHPDPDNLVISALSELTTSRVPDIAARFAPEPSGDEAQADERHELWRVDDEAGLAPLLHVLTRLPLYIADGHHRYETALVHAEEAGGPEDAATRFKMMLLTPMRDPGLLVLPTHRLVRIPEGESLGRMLAALREAGWHTEQPATLDGLQHRLEQPAPAGHVGFGMLADRRYGYLEGPADVGAGEVPLAPVMAALDVAVIHQRILAPLLGVTSDRLEEGGTVEYSRDPLEVRRRVVKGEFDVGFFLRAPALQQIKDVADAGESMPQKSTYFWPKPASGLLFMAQPPAGPI